MSQEVAVYLTRRRIAAFLVDSIVLAAAGFAMVEIFGQALIRLHEYQLLVGWLMAWLYYGPIAAASNNRTLGHMLLRLQIVDAAGQPLPLKQHAMRAIPLSLSAVVTSTNVPSITSVLVVAATVAAVGQLLMIFIGRRQERLVHDLLFNTHARRVDVPDAWTASPLPQYARALLAIAAIVVCGFYGAKFAEFGEYHHPLWMAYEQRYPLVAASWGDWHSTFATSGSKVTHDYFVVKLVTYEPYDAAMARDVARLALENVPASKATGSLLVTLTQTFRLGIINLSTTANYSHSPMQWLAEDGIE